MNVVSEPLQKFLDVAFSENEESTLLQRFGAWLDGRVANSEGQLYLFDSATATVSRAELRPTPRGLPNFSFPLFEPDDALLKLLPQFRQFAHTGTNSPGEEMPHLFTGLFHLPPQGRYFPILCQADFIGVLYLSESATNILCLPQVTKEIEMATGALGKALQRIWLAEELELAGHISPGLAHDLQNYLTPISTVLQLVREQKSHTAPELLELALDNVKLLDEHLQEALSLRTPLVFTRPVNLPACVQQAVRLVSTKAADKNVLVSVQGSATATITGASGLLFRLIGNLLKNAIEAAPAGSEVTVHWESTAQKGWQLRVSDCGAGILPETRRQMLATRFRERPVNLPGRGFGLGLAICRAVTRLHNGRLQILSRHPIGTVIQVELPNFR